jgi:uncharacterized protein YndB with AHSA1/START domain
MTTPDVPLRLDMTFDLPGTPEQVWSAIATADGISAWFTPTDLEERVGGVVTFHMGEDQSSTGEVTGWDPPGRLEYAEPEWAALAGHAGAPVTPLVSEFLVEAQSGGTCTLRVVSSAFGTGADWEEEFFAEMEKNWRPFFDNLRLYLRHFPGQQVTPLSAEIDVPGAPDPLWAALCDSLGLTKVGDRLDARGLTGTVERFGTETNELLVRLDGPIPGYVVFFAYAGPDDTSHAALSGYLFADGAPAFVDRARPEWQAWLEGLAVRAS